MGTKGQRAGELWVLRQARRLGFGRNPLRRSTDRLEAALCWAVLAVAVLLAPVAAAIGTSVRTAAEDSAQERRATLHEVAAHTLEGTENDVPATPGYLLTRARVGYVDTQGVEREGMTNVVIGTRAGDQLTVWLDNSGRIVAAPSAGADAAATGSIVGLLTVTGSWLLLWGAFRLARIPLDRRRARDLEAEWLAVSPRWLRGQK